MSIEELWLKKVYKNIVTNLIESTITKASEFDPFIEKFMGMNSITYDRYDYQALLEITSYFWASKGGRGSLLEKLLFSLGGQYAANGLTFKKIVNMLQRRLTNLYKVQENYNLTINEDHIGDLKFDLVNIIDDRLILLEVKNRVDSGGTSAREEALNKFFDLCNVIKSGKKIFEHDGRSLDFLAFMDLMRIKRLEMFMGLLFSVEGKEALIGSDRTGGFYSKSKNLMENFYNDMLSLENIKFNESALSLSFEKQGKFIILRMMYGGEVIRTFTANKYGLNAILEKVFTRDWDDIWLSLNISISERAKLLKSGSNLMILFNELRQNDREFETKLEAFCADSTNPELLRRMNEYVQNQPFSQNVEPFKKEKSYLSDCLYAFASYVSTKKRRKKAVIPS